MIKNTGVDFQLLREKRRYRSKISGLEYKIIVTWATGYTITTGLGHCSYVSKAGLQESFELITA